MCSRFCQNALRRPPDQLVFLWLVQRHLLRRIERIRLFHLYIWFNARSFPVGLGKWIDRLAQGDGYSNINAQQLADLNAVAALIAAKRHFLRIEVTTVRDDAEGPVREQATQKFRAIVSSAGDHDQHALVVPVLLSYGRN